MKRIAIFVLLLLFLSAVLPALVYAGNDNGASDVEITPKISIKGPKGRGKPAAPAATGVLGAPRPPSERRWAVIIGISDYAGEENDIQYADDDALDMLKALTEVYGYKRENILLLISDYATRDNILNAINWLKMNVRSTSETDDEVVFFYSGHGARGLKADADKEVVDEGIVPYECTAENVIWDGDLTLMFSNFDTTRIIFIFDSCYAGGMTDLKASGRVIAMASTESGVSYESSTLGNGVFTYYFVDEGMFQGLADITPTDGVITVEEAFDYAK
ncbi:MAG: caspase family protein, partial [Thermoproteota archaeon]